MREKKANAVADRIEETVNQTLAVFVLPPKHRQRLKSRSR
jgi:hypothetical protein